jgi:hypothetical protein
MFTILGPGNTTMVATLTIGELRAALSQHSDDLPVVFEVISSEGTIFTEFEAIREEEIKFCGSSQLHPTVLLQVHI